MRDLDNIDSYYERLLNEFSHLNQENSPCNGIKNVSIVVNKKRWKKRKKHNVFEHAQQPTIAFRLSRLSKYKKQASITKPSSMPELNKCTRPVPLRNKSSQRKDTKQNKYKQSPFQSKFIANVVSEHRFDNCFINPFNYPSQTKWKIYRCQISATEDGCCCSCNSDAMFEVMKGLYDCYKAKNCDNCCCVLCSYQLQEKRRLDEVRKSMASISRDKVLDDKTAAEKADKTRKQLGLPPSPKIAAEKAKMRMASISRDKVLDDKTAAEKADKTIKQLGLPPSPKIAAEKAKMRQTEAAGIITSLEGKTQAQKEEILRAQASRTASKKAQIDKIKAKKGLRSVGKSEFKETGLLTPLKGKTLEQREKILKGLAMTGLPLPEGQSSSEKKLIDKVRADLGLPMEPKTKSIREKHEQAAKAGLLQPLEGKTPAEKEKILKGLHDLGVSLPEGRTPSEKALVSKIAAKSRRPSRVVPPVLAPSKQMQRAKAEGVLTPLTSKSPEKKEKSIRARAMKGLPLPEAQSPSEKKLFDKVRADLGLPMEPKTKSIREKHEQAAKAGLLQPLEGKTPAEKEKILKGLHDLGVSLPEGRTPSEKALVSKIAAKSRRPSRVVPPVLAPSKQMQRAKAEGVLTPLTSKSPEKKEKSIRARAMKGLPLPEAQSPSEKKLFDKVRADLGLPMEPKTKSIRDKHEQAAKAGLLQPLEGKTSADQEKILRGLHELGIPLPVGRTPSEKALIAKVRGGPRALSAVLASSEQMRRTKAEGLLTPLKGKTPEKKEEILKALASRSIPLPEGQTPSEKKIVDKVRTDLGLPTEPKTKSIRDKHEQAAKASLLQQLEGKTPAEKEKTLKSLHDLGIPLPEGRTPSEKALIAKLAVSSRRPSRVVPPVLAPSEQMRRAKAEGLLTPLTGKTPEQKEKILKVHADLSLPTEPKTKSIRDKHEQAAKAGLLQPLEGKTPAEKEKVLKSLHALGISLPEGRPPSEKALIAKVAADSLHPSRVIPPVLAASEQKRRAKTEKSLTSQKGQTPEQKEKIKAVSLPAVTTDKIRKAKAAGLLTPLAGKTPEKKEKILQGPAEIGLPLPEGKTPSEKIDQIKKESGIPDKTPSEKLQKAAGLLTPLEGKSLDQKEKILRGRVAAGLPVPKGETQSEKKLISKLISRPLSVTQSEKLKAVKTAALLTPLKGKTSAQKEKIVEGLSKAGLPLPEGKTKSEKSMIARVKSRTPPDSKTPSEKSIIRKAKAAGLFTPITGKASAEKERILKGLAEAGLPLPVGTTASEKDLVKKIRAEVGLPIEPTASEKKFKIRKKEKKIGVSASKRAAGIEAEEFQDIIKTTTCDRGCGCDKKKIKFKHSYVKIRVTSPDISSICDCPDECLPGVKGGAFIDNEGIKVTIGSAVGIPSYSMECINQVVLDEIVSNADLSKTQTNDHNNLDDSKKPKYKVSSDLGLNNSNKMNYILNASSSDMNYSTRPYRIQSENIHGRSSIVKYQGRACKSDRIMESLRGLQSLDDVYKEPTPKLNSACSYETIVIIKNDMSLSTSTSNSMDSISLIWVIDSSNSSTSAHYSGYESTNDLLSINSLDGPTTSDDAINHPEIAGERDVVRNFGAVSPQHYTIMRMSQLQANFGNKKLRKREASCETEDPVVLFNQLPNKLDVSKIMFEIMSKKRFAAASSIFIVVPMSDDDEEQGSSNCVDSSTSILSNEYDFTASTTNPVDLGNSSSWFRLPGFCKTSTETSACKTPPCVSPRFNTMLPNHPRQHGCSQQNQKTKSPLPCSCLPDDFEKERNRSAEVQKPSIACCDGDIAPKNVDVRWFFSRKTASSELVCDIPPSCDFGSSPVTADHCHPYYGSSQQNQKTKCPSFTRCPPDDFGKERNRSFNVQNATMASLSFDCDSAPIKAGKRVRQSSACHTPPCTSPDTRQHCHSQLNQMTKSSSIYECLCPPEDFKETKNRSAKGKRDCQSSACHTPPCTSPDTRQHCHSQLNQMTKSSSINDCLCPPEDFKETKNRSAKGKTVRQSSACHTPPCTSPDTRQHCHSQLNQMTKSSSINECLCPPEDFKETKNRSAKGQKPSLQSMPYDSAPKKAGGFCSSKRASSELVCGIPPSAAHCHQHCCSQHYHQTTVSMSPCFCPPDDTEETSCPWDKRAGAKNAGK